jgi:hypothetical protein
VCTHANGMLLTMVAVAGAWCWLQGDLDAASSSYDAAKQACSSSSSSSVSERLRQEVTADVIMGQAQVGQGRRKV